ncbi:MAG: GNAT family N-acetyltransferase [Planctomycetes bacterium]|nr:GNAT family N-acetyltransferase [Planctomycetota bacterium]
MIDDQSQLQIRLYQQGDHGAIAEIFTTAIHEIASRDYTPEQCQAWAGRTVNFGHWKNRCERKRPFVAVVDSTIAGFLELDPDGHIDCAYIHPRFQRRGIMTQLVEHAVATCFARHLRRVYVEASICARPLFEKCGFQTICENVVKIGEIALLNYKMEKMIDDH